MKKKRFKKKKKHTKKIIYIFLLIILLIIISFLGVIISVYKSYVSDFKLNKGKYKESLKTYNEDITYDDIKYTSNYNLVVKNKNDLKNLYFTFINSSSDQIIFKCNYKGNCIDDINEIKNKYRTSITNVVLSSSYDFSYDYYSLINIFKTNYVELKRVIKNDSLKMDSVTKDEIYKIYEKNYDESLSAEENIKIFHDYIIDNITYQKYKENNAQSALKHGKASSYAYCEILKTLLDYLNVKNTIITSDRLNTKHGTNHTWNLVYLNDKWYHIDAAFDDPDNNVSNNNDKYKFFLIDTDTLYSYNSYYHVIENKWFKAR